MLNKIWGWIKEIFWIDIEPEEKSQEREIPHYKTPDVWPFDGPRPPMEVVDKFYRGLETFKDHIMYRDPDTGKPMKGVSVGDQFWNIRMLMWWLAECEPKEQFKDRKILMIANSCNMQYCCHADHLMPRFHKLKKSPEKRVKDLEPIKTATNPPPASKARKRESVASGEGSKPKATGFKYSDRTKCVSAKIWHPTLIVAQQEASAYNKHRKPKGQPRLYGYECDWCDGAHFTKQNPNKRKKYKHTGSW